MLGNSSQNQNCFQVGTVSKLNSGNTCYHSAQYMFFCFRFLPEKYQDLAAVLFAVHSHYEGVLSGPIMWVVVALM
jgi:hypothetical protein